LRPSFALCSLQAGDNFPLPNSSSLHYKTTRRKDETENELVSVGRAGQLPVHAGPGKGGKEPGTSEGGGAQTRDRREGKSQGKATQRVGSPGLHQQSGPGYVRHPWKKQRERHACIRRCAKRAQGWYVEGCEDWDRCGGRCPGNRCLGRARHRVTWTIR